MQQFHAHLDACDQCRTHPFNLCPIGMDLLRSAADERATLDPDGRLGAVERDHTDPIDYGAGELLEPGHGHGV